ncbi:MAG: DUF342 domain-containing protein [Phycisphaerales bacterium]|nr:MAG: DUF342 domain-containing protein [Phycisphaerales bacterium]
MADGIDACVQTSFGPERLTAVVRLVPGIDPAQFDLNTLLALIASAGIDAKLINEPAVRQLLENYKANPAQGVEGVVAEGCAAEHGQDGRLELTPEFDEALDRQREAKRRNKAVAEGQEKPPQDATPADHEGVSHYDQSPFCIVKPGVTIGRVHEPTQGTDGHDVQGKVLAAKEGKPFKLQCDDTIELRADGTVVTRVHGQLEHAGSLVRVLPTLDIEGYVDFSTGHIRFPGDIVVQKGVRDNFIVESMQAVHVRELVEAAHIQSEDNVLLDRGMAGREKGRLDVGADLQAKYLDGATAEIAGDCVVAKEITNCDVRVRGRLASPTCAIVGGSVSASRGIEVLQVGTGAGAVTEVIVGKIEELEQLALRASEMIPALEARLTKAEGRLKQLASAGARKTSQQAEELTELQFEVTSAQSQMQPVIDALLRTLQMIDRATLPELVVHRRLHAKAVVWIGAFKAEITDELKGPLRVSLDASGDPVLTDLTTESQVPLRQIARVVRETRFPDLAALQAIARGEESTEAFRRPAA